MNEEAPTTSHLQRTWQWILGHPYRVALVLYAAVGAFVIHDWDGFVFRTATSQFLSGTTPYQAVQDPEWYMFLRIDDTRPEWYAYPPLPLLLMAATYWPAELLALPEPAARLLLKLPMILGTMGLAWVAGQWTEHIGRPHLKQRVERGFLFHPLIVLVGPAWGMTDPLLMAFLLLAALRFSQGRPVTGGVWFAASVLVKPFPILLAVPLLAYALHEGRRRDVGRMAGTATAVGAAVCIPFIVTAPAGFWQQVAGMHLGRPAQGHTMWRAWPLEMLPTEWVSLLSWLLMAGGLAIVAGWATRTHGKAAPVWILGLAAVALLAWNRVVNPQYLVLVVAPFLLLARAGVLDRLQRRLVEGAAAAYAAIILFEGYHFLTFFPPDVAMFLFGRPVDEVAHSFAGRLSSAPTGGLPLADIVAWLVPASLVAIGLAVVRPHGLRRPAAWLRVARQRRWASAAPSVGVLALLTFASVLTPAAPSDDDGPVFDARYDEPRVGAFYYLWWHNPSHDPEAMYGNWLRVSQSPAMGYYTNTRALQREHVAQMLDAGIDTAVVSYHRGEGARYAVFQEEAQAQGLWVAPLIELNQVYDKRDDAGYTHRPVDANGTPVAHAAYRLSDGTRDEIVDFVLDLRPGLRSPSAMRVDGRPVVFFYDSYVSSPSFHIEDKARLAEVVIQENTLTDLRSMFNDRDLRARTSDVLQHHPPDLEAFYYGGPAAVWRQAHLSLHERFWNEIRAELEAELGPLYLVSGDAFNDRAGFEAGTVKSLAGLDVFDGSFIYSPSFTWGNHKGDTFEDNFRRWEDRNHWLQAFSAGQGRLSAVGLAPAYDDTVNRPEGFIIPPEHAGVSTYDRSWLSVSRTPPDFAIVATWNEFFEGSSIEPSIEDGDAWMRATSGHRSTFAAAVAEPREPIVMMMHEKESRTGIHHSEMDTPHAHGLELLAHAMRAYPDLEPYAYDAADGGTWPEAVPAAVVVDGGRAHYDVAPSVVAKLREWARAGVPVVLFGPELAAPLDALVGSCRGDVDDVAGADDMLPDDVLTAGQGTVRVERGLAPQLVATRCGDVYYAAYRPWGLGAETDEACVGWFLASLGAPQPGSPTACPAASGEAFEEAKQALVPGHSVGGPGTT